MREVFCLCILFVLSCSALGAAETGHPFLAADYTGNKVCIISADGKLDWEFPTPNSTDVWMLPNGNILFSQRDGAREVTREKKVVWEYKTAKGNEVYACQRLPSGDTLIGELGPCRLIEVAPDGTIKKIIPIDTLKDKVHLQFRNARKLASGNYLVACNAEHVIKEFDGDGKIVWSVPVKGDPFCAIRLKNGNTLIGAGDGHRIVEVDAAGKTVWEVEENELPGIPLRFIAGLQRLENGNTIVCNWLGHGHIGKGLHAFEITRDKKVVWKYEDHALFKTISSLQLLDVKGDAVKGELER